MTMLSPRVALLSINIVLLAFAPIVYGNSNDALFVQGTEVNVANENSFKVLEDLVKTFAEYRNAYKVQVKNQVGQSQDLIRQALDTHETEASDIETDTLQDDSNFEDTGNKLFDHHAVLTNLAFEHQEAIRNIDTSYLRTLVKFERIVHEMEKSKQKNDLLSGVLSNTNDNSFSRIDYLVSNEITEMEEKLKYGNICLSFVGASGQVNDGESQSSLIDEIKTALNLAILEQGQELKVIAARVKDQKYVGEKDESRRNLRAGSRINALNGFTQELRASFLVGLRCTKHCPDGEWFDLGEKILAQSVDSGTSDAGHQFFSSKLEKSFAEALRIQVGGVLGHVITVESFPCGNMA